MQLINNQDYKQLLTEVIKKQIVILGPEIALTKARNVSGLTVSDDGTVINVIGTPEAVTQALVDQFVQLSGLIVKETMGPLLSPSFASTAQHTVSTTTQPTPPSTATPIISHVEHGTTSSPTSLNPAVPANQTITSVSSIEGQNQPLPQMPPAPIQSSDSISSTAPSILPTLSEPSATQSTASSAQTPQVPIPAANPLAS